MKANKYDWSAIANNTRFRALQRKKRTFLISLWVLGSLPYVLLTVGAGYSPEVFNARVFGRMNVGYLSCIFQFFWMVGIAFYYAYRSNHHFDPLTQDFLREIHEGGAK